jgi:hypothetical protein
MTPSKPTGSRTEYKGMLEESASKLLQATHPTPNRHQAHNAKMDRVDEPCGHPCKCDDESTILNPAHL